MKNKMLVLGSGEVESVLEGTKTQHRIPMIVQPPDDSYSLGVLEGTTGHKKNIGSYYWLKIEDGSKVIADQGVYFRPPYEVGDIVGVKETFCIDCPGSSGFCCYKAQLRKQPAADFCGGSGKNIRWSSPVIMPKQLIRIWLEITSRRHERLHQIGKTYHDDLLREGYPWGLKTERGEGIYNIFIRYWDSTRGRKYQYNYDHNPWIWIYEFQRIPNR